MSIEFLAEKSTLGFNSESLAQYEKFFDLLKFIDKNDRIITGRLPDDAGTFSGYRVDILPFKMDSLFSHPEEGAWKVNLSKEEDLKKFWIQTTPATNGAYCNVTVTDENDAKGYRDASDDEIIKLAEVLAIINSNVDINYQPTGPNKNSERKHSWLQRILPKIKKGAR